MSQYTWVCTFSYMNLLFVFKGHDTVVSISACPILSGYLLWKWLKLELLCMDSKFNKSSSARQLFSRVAKNNDTKLKTCKGPSINDVGPFFRFYDPPPSTFVVFLLSKFQHFWHPLPPPLRRYRLWMAPNSISKNIHQVWLHFNLDFTFHSLVLWLDWKGGKMIVQKCEDVFMYDLGNNESDTYYKKN